MSFKLFQTAHTKVARFRQNRGRQSDEQFLAECGIQPGTDLARVAIGVRRCVADAGLVDSAFIRPTDRYPDDLGVLPLWDSMDFVDLAIRVEDELGVHWNYREDSNVFSVPFTVHQLIDRVAAVAAPPPLPATEPAKR